MMAESSDHEGREKDRLCPLCRMPISILATKCRYCGELVGRAREKDRKLSVLDIGGSAPSCAPGEEVVDAFEAFRQEELTAVAQKEGRHRNSLGARAIVYLTVCLVPCAWLLVAFGFLVAWELLSGPGVLFLAAITVCLVAFGFLVKSSIEYYRTRRNAGAAPAIKNPAIAILDGNGPPLDALEAAIKTLSQSDTRDNRIVLQRARRQIVKEANALLDSMPQTWANLNLASELVSEALSVDPYSEVLRGLSKQVNEELELYSRK